MSWKFFALGPILAMALCASAESGLSINLNQSREQICADLDKIDSDALLNWIDVIQSPIHQTGSGGDLRVRLEGRRAQITAIRRGADILELFLSGLELNDSPAAITRRQDILRAKNKNGPYFLTIWRSLLTTPIEQSNWITPQDTDRANKIEDIRKTTLFVRRLVREIHSCESLRIPHELVQ